MSDHTSPFNAIPPVVLLLTAALALPELLFWASKSGLVPGARGGDDMRLFALQRFAFSGELMDRMRAAGQYPFAGMIRLISYPFVHASFTQMVFAAVFVLALGKMVGEVFSQMAVAVIFFASAICGALIYTLLLDDPRPLIGGFPAAYGLIGAYTFILWVGYGAVGQNQYRAFSLIGFLLAIQLVFGLLFGGGNDWVAELGGFVTGLILSIPLSPHGTRRLLEALRRR
ncbi:MAG: rhomboid family intramembrane serine protease [Confluentimicrobium sp.]|nr:rhomboid family intramembrane serine protease [Actibacterium sp.]MBF54463.1 rhomboid family intramembrane serine protease [Actibacterium sp.]|tara:strand:- start:500 stop:1183 length:684 start_codon:yes stop_codon:yes gene_type:complete